MALLASWSKRYFDDKDKNWKKLIGYKYNTAKPNILWSRNGVGSPFWKGLTWDLSAARCFYKWKIGNGKMIDFWHDWWVGHCSLKTQFWDLYDICLQQKISVAKVWDGSQLKLSFRRCVDQALFDQWVLLCDLVGSTTLTADEDVPVWMLEICGCYSVKSFYTMINFGGVICKTNNSLSKIVAPPKIHVFLWLLVYNKILTRDNSS